MRSRGAALSTLTICTIGACSTKSSLASSSGRPGIEASSIYYRWLIFLGVSAAFSLAYNLWAYRNSRTVFSPVPLAEVYAEAEEISEHLPLEVEPGGPHLHHDPPGEHPPDE